MKRLFYLMLVVLGTAAFTACSDDDDNNNGSGNSNDGNGTITMVTEGEKVKLNLHTLNEGDKVTIDWGDGLTETYQSVTEEDNGDIYYTIEIERNYTGGNHTITIQEGKIITELLCDECNLTSLDVNGGTALTYLSCCYNKLTSLNVSKNTALIYLECYYNQLTSLDVSKNTALIDLGCENNRLTSLDLSKNTVLEEVSCEGNQFTAAEMNKFYESLPTVESGRLYCAQLGDPSIAEQKGWQVSFPEY